MYQWNRAFNKIEEIKKEFISKFGEIDVKQYQPFNNVIELMVSNLKNEEYIKLLSNLTINQYLNFIILHYNITDFDCDFKTNPNSILRECRGLVIDIENDAIVNCPFKKFFNIDEIEETSMTVVLEKIKKSDKFEITDKLDGSMIAASLYRNEVFVSSSENCNPYIAWRVKESKEFIDENPNYKSLITENPDKTFIFEFINPKDMHFVLYRDKPQGLYLIGIRDNLTGKELPYEEVMNFAEKYSLLSTKIEVITFDELLNLKDSYSYQEKEGWVLSIDDFKVKFKCDDYLRIHTSLAKKGLCKMLLVGMVENTIDDIISSLNPVNKEIALEMTRKIFEYIQTESAKINAYYEKAPKSNKKEFVAYVKENVPKEYFSNVINKYENKPFNIIRYKTGQYIKPSQLGIIDIIIEDPTAEVEEE